MPLSLPAVQIAYAAAAVATHNKKSCDPVVYSCASNFSNLTKYTTPQSTRSTVLATLASSLMNTSPFPTRFQSSANLATIMDDNFAVSVLTSIPRQLVPLPPPSFTQDSITLIFFITASLKLSLQPDSELTCKCMLLLRLLNPVTSLLS